MSRTMPHETGALPVAQGDGAVVQAPWGLGCFFGIFSYQGAIFFRGKKGFVFVNFCFCGGFIFKVLRYVYIICVFERNYILGMAP